MNIHAHRPVLLEESVQALAIERRPEGIWVDATFGRGGHSRRILERLDPRGRLIAFDRDADAIRAGRSIDDARLTLVHAPFGELSARLSMLGITQVDGVLLDLGVSSPQLEDPERGFSFRRDGPLDMRMDQTRGHTAAEWLAQATENQIREALERYGEERFAQQIAKAIVAARQGGPIQRTRELAGVVGQAVRTREPGQDPATRTFQALRIHLNQELEELSLVLTQALSVLAPGGRIAAISFHSLEDRMVKRFFREQSQPRVPERLPLRAAEMPPVPLRTIGRAIRPSAAEVAANPRARSAVLRVAEKA